MELNMKKDLSYVCNYLKALVIPDMPDDFVVAEKFKHGLTEDEIRKGILAFRDFLYVLFDKLAADKDKIDVKTGSKYDIDGYIGDNGDGNIFKCFPSICDLGIILFSLGFHGILETSHENKLTVNSEDLFTVISPKSERWYSLVKMSDDRKLEMFHLLSDFGLRFDGADFLEEVDFSKVKQFDIAYEKNNYFIVGLKMIAEAAANVKSPYIGLSGTFLRCDFYPLANEKPQKQFVDINEFANAQPPEVKEWIKDTDVFLTDNGCRREGTWEFTYFRPKAKSKVGMVCRIHMDIRGCFVTPGVNHLAKLDSMPLPDEIVNLMKAERKCG